MAGLLRNRLVYVITLAILFVAAVPAAAFAADSETPALYATGWAILPPVVAIALALITKEVYSSLFLGVLTGGILYTGGNFSATMNHVFQDGIIASLSDSWNVGILVFLIILGIFVAMINLSGGSAAFGKWAGSHIKTRKGAQISTIMLGLLIFVDDYFNCLTVGSVMKPLTDEYHISRAKLAYLVDATAAPVCIIAPISSWAAAVTGFVKGQNGLTVFIHAIPYNFYALLTIVMMFAIITMDFDYGKMRTHEENAKENGDLFSVPGKIAKSDTDFKSNENGRVGDLILPIIVLIASCVLGMIYTGGFFSGASFVEAFANSDASIGLVYGSFIAMVLTVIYYTIRRVLPFSECMECVPEGFKTMVSPVVILTLAWSLKAMTDSLGLAPFVANAVGNLGSGFMSLFPAIIFLVACGLGIASGTSWGTFGILIPIAIAVTAGSPELMIIGISACMAGAVCGDHCSPISDTTIMASAGAGCNHVSHVETQFPYAATVAAVSFITYLVAGFTRSPWISLPVGIILLLFVLKFIKSRQTKLTTTNSTL